MKTKTDIQFAVLMIIFFGMLLQHILPLLWAIPILLCMTAIMALPEKENG